jgi:DNA-binding MarR family transcriptional regulator
MGIIDELGLLGLASRLQRLSDTLRKDATAIFNKYKANFTVKWYPVLLALSRRSPVNLAELASELKYTHPSIIQLVNEMEEEKLVKSASHKKDGRKRMVTLTEKGSRKMEEIKPIVAAFEKVMTEITDTRHNLLKAVEEVEKQLQIESLFEREARLLKKETASKTFSALNKKLQGHKLI